MQNESLSVDRERAIQNCKARDTFASNQLLDVGVHGNTALMDLPGVDWEDFWVPGAAHAALLGATIEVIGLLHRENNEKLTDGNEYRLRNAVNSREVPMKDRTLQEVRKLRKTSLYKRGLDNVIAYATFPRS
jgi:hypothetical protein